MPPCGEIPKGLTLWDVEGFLPPWVRLSGDNPLRLLLKRIEEAQEPPPPVRDPYRAVYPERRDAERHVNVLGPAEGRADWERPGFAKRRNRSQRQNRDPIKAAYDRRHSQ